MNHRVTVNFQGLRFPFAELVKKTLTLRKIAALFLCRNTNYFLDKFAKDIDSFKAWSAGSTARLQLRRIMTKPTNLYGSEINAAFSGVWDVTSVPIKKQSTPTKIMFSGIASTKIELYCAGNATNPIAMWRLELGAHDSPGCCFHAQILGNCDKPPFPKSIPIPRLPSLFVTPMAAIEYGIGELFQEEWRKHAARKSGDLDYWHGIQQYRLKCLFDWYKNSLTEGKSSPWMNLKEIKPKSALFH